ncbi:hypothetical protein AB0K00_21645 [Dactylosporangium sp. NPDC049525]|uniref:hypothetical protein n=1 Tax=Dactylosporangium sp. NPDC049525 TaxID=3154730 RepID=UPI00341A5B06
MNRTTATEPDITGLQSGTNRPGAGGTRAPHAGAPASPTGRDDIDAELLRAVRRATLTRRVFYLIVIIVALAGQASGAVQTLHIPLLWAIPAVAALELGGVVILSNADVRRRLGERATGSRILSALIAAGAVVFNWTSHPQPLHGGFFAGMSALGYLVWSTDAGNARRDRLRAHGALPPTTPAYEPLGHWLRHPQLTHRARSLAKANPQLGLFASIAAANAQLDAERRRKAIATVLHRKIRANVDPATADIAVAVYDLNEIANRLADRADYETLTDLIARDLAPPQLADSPHRPDRPPATPASPTTAGTPLQQRTRLFPTDTAADQAATPLTQPSRPTAPLSGNLSSDHTETDAIDVATHDITHASADAPAAVPAIDDALPPDAERTGADKAAQKGEPRPPSGVPAPGQTEPVQTTHISAAAAGADGSAGPDAGPQETAAAVAYWRRREPGISPGEVAARVGRSTRTVYRHWDAIA